MKSDVLTLAVVVFVVGILISGLGLPEIFDSEESATPPTELQMGANDNRYAKK